VLVPACSDDSADPADEGCNDLVNDGPEVRDVVQAGPAPTPSGGTIEDGTYELTALNYFGVNPPVSSGVTREVLVIAGTTAEAVVIDIYGGESRFTFNITTSGTTIISDVTCSGESSSTASFTATLTEFRSYDGALEWIVEAVFSKR
jgi:hypothetical protein